MRSYLPALDPARRILAPESLWGVWRPVMGAHASRHAPFHGKRYGAMEAQDGLCAVYPQAGADDCKGWYTRLRHLPLETAAPDEPLRHKNLQDCTRDAQGVTRCTISASGAHFDPDGTLTITLYIRPFDLQYRASFATLGAYLANAVTQRGLTARGIRDETHFLAAAARRLKDTATRANALSRFCQHPTNRAAHLSTLAAEWLQAHALPPHNKNPEAGDPRLVRTHHR